MASRKTFLYTYISACTQFLQRFFERTWGDFVGTPRAGLFQTMQTIAWGSMEKYVQLWSCPGASSKAGHLPDLLTIFPIVRHYLHTIIMPAGSCPKACEAFLAHADLLDQVHQGTMYGATTRASLLPAAEFAIQSFQEADFGVPLMKKWHWLLHLPDFLQSHGTLPSTFTTERKHKTIGKLATNLQKTTAFESHLMQQVVAMEIITLKEPGLFPDSCQLVKPKKATKQQLGVLRDLVDGPPWLLRVRSLPKVAPFMPTTWWSSTTKTDVGKSDKSGSIGNWAPAKSHFSNGGLPRWTRHPMLRNAPSRTSKASFPSTPSSTHCCIAKHQTKRPRCSSRTSYTAGCKTMMLHL